MRTRVFAGTVVMLLFVLAFVAGGYAAANSYQFTGTVQAVTSNSVTVRKNAKETWQFELAKDAKSGAPKVGDRVTIHYKMVATEVERGAGTR